MDAASHFIEMLSKKVRQCIFTNLNGNKTLAILLDILIKVLKLWCRREMTKVHQIKAVTASMTATKFWNTQVFG